MSTTRPLLGLRRGSELPCSEQPASRLPAAASRLPTEAPTLDEFTVLEDKEEELKCAKPRVEQVFKVKFTIIGLLDHTGQRHGSRTSRQIWLQLVGDREDVSRAKVRLHTPITVCITGTEGHTHAGTCPCCLCSVLLLHQTVRKLGLLRICD